MTPSREEIEDDIVVVIEDKLYKKQERKERERRMTGAGKWDALLGFLAHSGRIFFWLLIMVAMLSLLSIMKDV